MFTTLLDAIDHFVARSGIFGHYHNTKSCIYAIGEIIHKYGQTPLTTVSHEVAHSVIIITLSMSCIYVHALLLLKQVIK